MTAQGPLPPPGNVVKVTMGWTESASITYGTRFFLQYVGGPISQSDLSTICSQISSGFSTNLASHTPSDVVLSTVQAQDLASATGAIASNAPGIVGTDSAASLDSGAATVVNFHTAYHFRGGHPKTFMPGGSTAVVVQPASWSAAYISAYGGGFSAMVSNATAHAYSSITSLAQVYVSWYATPIANTNPSVWARKNVPKLRTTPVLHGVTSVSVMPIIGSQRRRRRSTGT